VPAIVSPGEQRRVSLYVGAGGDDAKDLFDGGGPFCGPFEAVDEHGLHARGECSGANAPDVRRGEDGFAELQASQPLGT